MSSEDLVHAAVERLRSDKALRGNLNDTAFTKILDRAVEHVRQAAAAGGCDSQLSARIKEIVVEVRAEVEAAMHADASSAQRRPIRQPEARRH